MLSLTLRLQVITQFSIECTMQGLKMCLLGRTYNGGRVRGEGADGLRRCGQGQTTEALVAVEVLGQEALALAYLPATSRRCGLVIVGGGRRGCEGEDVDGGVVA